MVRLHRSMDTVGALLKNNVITLSYLDYANLMIYKDLLLLAHFLLFVCNVVVCLQQNFKWDTRYYEYN